jgi:3'-phosphoadenosine 5'-phosphosulfate sulfotransferase (PAPS reductase)/FAD synthetase
MITHIASVSGGKDSTAMALHLQERGIEFTPVFMDTGWEHPETYRYVRDELPKHIGEITWLRADIEVPEELEPVVQEFEERLGHYSAFVRLAFRKAIFPARTVRFCTHELKLKPIRAYLAKRIEQGEAPVSVVGIRAAESAARAKLPEKELSVDMDCLVWRPIIDWSEQDVIDIHHKHGIIPNKLYLLGAQRVGCFPCVMARKDSIRLMGEIMPERVALIRDLEHAVTAVAESRSDEPLKWKRSMFQGSRATDPLGIAPPIDRVMEWANTSRGGLQSELFAPNRREGCMRWGLCDVVAEDA